MVWYSYSRGPCPHAFRYGCVGPLPFQHCDLQAAWPAFRLEAACGRESPSRIVGPRAWVVGFVRVGGRGEAGVGGGGVCRAVVELDYAN